MQHKLFLYFETSAARAFRGASRAVGQKRRLGRSPTCAGMCSDKVGLRPSLRVLPLLFAGAGQVGAVGLICLVLGHLAQAQVGLVEQAGVAAAQAELAGQAPHKRAAKLAQAKQRSPANLAGSPAAVGDFAAELDQVPCDFMLSLKLVGLALVVLLWIRGGEWINHDVQIFKLGWYKWNPIIFFPFVVTALVLFFLPVATWVRIPILLVVLLACWLPYVVVHNQSVQPHQTVLTRDWWRFAFAKVASKLGVQVSTERKAAYEMGVDVDLIPMGGEDANADNANLLSARNSPGYLLVKDAVATMVQRRCEKVLYDFTQQAVNVRYEIDGVWHNGTAIDRESGDVMLAVMKTLANLNIKDRRHQQSGKFGAKYEGKSFIYPLVTQGVPTGERAVLTRIVAKQEFSDYAELGMREALREKWAAAMAADQGLLILASLPGGGLSTITEVSLHDTDRLMRDFVSIEDAQHPEPEIQNINVTTYDSAAGETPATILPQLIRTYPHVYICRDFVDPETADLLLKEVRDERLVITTMRAREAAEVLLRMLQKKIPAKDFAATVKAVLYQRLVRLLCPECKVGYTPPADVLRKLGIPVGKVEQLYRPPKPEETDRPCQACQGFGYAGRTGIFELLEVTDKIREILVKQPRLELLKKAAKASGQRSLQEEGVLLVAKGQTSLPELMRVLKQ